MLYFEDMVPGTTIVGPNVVVELEEMIEFARRWGPLPQHIDDKMGQPPFVTLTAPGIYIPALKQRLIHQLDEQQAVIASLGYDEVRFYEAVRPNDCITLKLEWIKKGACQNLKKIGDRYSSLLTTQSEPSRCDAPPRQHPSTSQRDLYLIGK